VLQCPTGSWSGGDRCWFGRRSARGKRRETMNDKVIVIAIIIIIIMVKFTEDRLENIQLTKPVTMLITDCTFLRPPFSG